MIKSTISQVNMEIESTIGQGKASDLISRQKVLNIIDWVHYNFCFSPSEEKIFDHLKGVFAECEASTIAPDTDPIARKALEAGERGEEVRFYIGGRKFAVRELAQ